MYHRTLSNDSNTILFQRVTRECEVSLLFVRYPSRGARPHGSRNQNCMRGHCRPSIQGTRSHRRKRCLSPANDTDTPREALLKHNESYIAVLNLSDSFVAVVKTRHDALTLSSEVRGNYHCVCERVSRVCADSRAGLMGSEIGIGTRGSPIIGPDALFHCLTTFSIAPSRHRRFDFR